MLQNATPLRKSPPWSLNTSTSCDSCIAPATRHSSFQIVFKCATPAIVFETATKPSRFANFSQGAESPVPATQNNIWTSKSAPYPSVLHFWLGHVLCATTAFTFSTSELPKVLRGWGAFYILTWKSASRHSGVHFFNLNFQKCSECRVLMRVLCMWASKSASRHNGVRFFNFSTSKSASNPSVFNTLTSKFALRHNGVHFFDISPSKSGPRKVCFAHFDLEMCFAPQRRATFHVLSGHMALYAPL